MGETLQMFMSLPDRQGFRKSHANNMLPKIQTNLIVVISRIAMIVSGQSAQGRYVQLLEVPDGLLLNMDY